MNINFILLVIFILMLMMLARVVFTVMQVITTDTETRGDHQAPGNQQDNHVHFYYAFHNYFQFEAAKVNLSITSITPLY